MGRKNTGQQLTFLFIPIRFFLILILLLILVGCGKMKIDSSTQKVEVSDSNHRIDIVHQIDMEGLYEVFTPMCESKFAAMEDSPERDEKVALCVEQNIDKVLDIVGSGSIPGGTEDNSGKDNDKSKED